MNKNIVYPVHILAVAALVRNEEGKILLVHCRRRGWEFPGGQVENGENLIEAVMREVKEESGVDVTIDRLVGLYSNTGGYESPDGHYIPTKLMVDFTGHAVGAQELRLSHEHDDIRWVEDTEAVEMVTHPHYKIRLNNMLRRDGKVALSACYKAVAVQENTEFIVTLDERLPV